jgi:hypothetical protein
LPPAGSGAAAIHPAQHEVVYDLDYRARPLVDLTERDWSQAMLAGRYYSIMAGTVPASDEERQRHELVQSVFGDMLAPREDTWAYRLKVRRVANLCLPEWNQTSPDERNSPKLRDMIEQAGYFDSLLGYLSRWPGDADMMFNTITVASRLVRDDILTEIEKAVASKGGLAFMKKVVAKNEKFDRGDSDFFRAWSYGPSAAPRWSRSGWFEHLLDRSHPLARRKAPPWFRSASPSDDRYQAGVSHRNGCPPARRIRRRLLGLHPLCGQIGGELRSIALRPPPRSMPRAHSSIASTVNNGCKTSVSADKLLALPQRDMHSIPRQAFQWKTSIIPDPKAVTDVYGARRRGQSERAQIEPGNLAGLAGQHVRPPMVASALVERRTPNDDRHQRFSPDHRRRGDQAGDPYEEIPAVRHRCSAAAVADRHFALSFDAPRACGRVLQLCCGEALAMAAAGRKRDIAIRVMVTAKEQAEIRKAANKAAMPMSVYVRAKALEASRGAR